MIGPGFKLLHCPNEAGFIIQHSQLIDPYLGINLIFATTISHAGNATSNITLSFNYWKYDEPDTRSCMVCYVSMRNLNPQGRRICQL